MMVHRMTYEAYKTVDGVEVEHIDPCISFRFRENQFSIWNGVCEYEQPLAELKFWNVRELLSTESAENP